MKNYILLIFLFTTTACMAEHKVKTYFEKTDNGYNIYADNSEVCPVSIRIEFKVKNLRIEGGNNRVYVVEPLKKKQLLTSLKTIKKGKPYSLSFNSLTNYGNHNKNSYDRNYAYNLPYKSSNTFKIDQGYNGAFSHNNENSLDFKMPIGTELMAIREGIVVKVVDNNNKNCARKECEQYNNLIMIYHPDGTFAEYAHIKQEGSVVKVGDKVSKGQLIGYSGNVGWSTGPHLHLVVFKQKLKERETLKTKFKTEDGTKNQYLIEKQEYTRNY